MENQTLEQRVVTLEQQMTGPDGVVPKIAELGLQNAQLHGAMDVSFAALDANLRDEIRAGDGETRRQLREEIRAGDEETRRQLRDEIRGSEEETRRRMVELHGQMLAALDRSTAANAEAIRRQLAPLLARIRPNDETSQP